MFTNQQQIRNKDGEDIAYMRKHMKLKKKSDITKY